MSSASQVNLPSSTPASVTSPAASHPRIVILGGGFAGAYCARALERRLVGRDAEIILVDRNNFFIFYPLLVEAGIGSLEPRHIVVSLRNFLKRARFRMGEVAAFDFPSREVLLRGPGEGVEERLPFDHLVLALGSVTVSPPIPGLAQYGFQMKRMADAIGLRDRAIRLLEIADATPDPALRREWLHLVVVGGNFTGVEVAGEFEAFLRRAARNYPNLSREDIQVTLVESGSRILSALDEDLADFARRAMERRGIRVILNNPLTEIQPDHAVLRDGTRLRTRTVIWCAGIAPSPVLRAAALPLDKRGYILCERDLRVRGMENVWGIGDCAVNLDADGNAYPATAQHAVRQATHLARNIAAVLNGRPTRPCNFKTVGSIAAIGCRSGVARLFGVKLSGFAAWWMFRTVYLLKIPGFWRKVRVALDWTLDLFLGREYVQLGIHHPRDEKSAENSPIAPAVPRQ